MLVNRLFACLVAAAALAVAAPASAATDNTTLTVVDAEGIVAAMFRQHTSRSLDPQLHTHLVIATSCAEAVADQAGEELDLWLLEPLAYTKSNEHAGTPGTVWLGPETLLRVLDDIGRSLAATLEAVIKH